MCSTAHRRDPTALHHAFWGYGVGLSAVMTKLLVEERELTAPASGMWLWRQYRTAVLPGLLGKASRGHVRVAWDYLRGGFAGPRGVARGAARAGSRAAARRPARHPRNGARCPSAAATAGAPGGLGGGAHGRAAGGARALPRRARRPA